MRENAESIALIGGEERRAQRPCAARCASWSGRWLEVIAQQARMTWFINGNAVLAPVFPLLLGGARNTWPAT